MGGGLVPQEVLWNKLSFNNERKLLHITKYYTCFREPCVLMNSLINWIQTMCIIWRQKMSVGQAAPYCCRLRVSTSCVLAQHDLYGNYTHTNCCTFNAGVWFTCSKDTVNVHLAYSTQAAQWWMSNQFIDLIVKVHGETMWHLGIQIVLMAKRRCCFFFPQDWWVRVLTTAPQAECWRGNYSVCKGGVSKMMMHKPSHLLRRLVEE